jgi:hypothetical protein
LEVFIAAAMSGRRKQQGYAPVDPLEPVDPPSVDADEGQVLAFFQRLRLKADYSEAIERHGIDGRVLHEISCCSTKIEQKGVLEQMGIKVADALKITHALRHTRGDSPIQRPIQRPLRQTSLDAQETRKATYNPLLSEGFRSAQLRPGADEIEFAEELDFVGQNPAAISEQRTPRKSVLAPPRWSMPKPGAEDNYEDEEDEQDEKLGNMLGVVLKTIFSWKEHFKLILIVLGVIFVYELSYWLYNGGVSAIFLFIAASPICMQPILMMGALRIAAPDHLEYAFCKHRVLIAMAVGFVFMFMNHTAPPNISPVLPGRIVSSLGFLFWNWGIITAYPAYLIYIFRQAFNWDRSRLVLLLMTAFSWIWLVVVMCFQWSFPEYTFLTNDIFSGVLLAVIFVLFFLTGIYDTMLVFARNRPIRLSGEYMILLVFYILLFPWLCAGFLAVLQKMLTKVFGDTPTGMLVLLLLWSVLLAVVYLNVRLIASRCLPYTAIPVLILPLQLVGDLFTELVFMDFSMSDWQFWVSDSELLFAHYHFVTRAASPFCFHAPRSS